MRDAPDIERTEATGWPVPVSWPRCPVCGSECDTFYRDRDWNVGGTLIFSKNRNTVLSLGNSVEAGLNTDKRTGMLYEFYGNSSEMYT